MLAVHWKMVTSIGRLYCTRAPVLPPFIGTGDRQIPRRPTSVTVGGGFFRLDRGIVRRARDPVARIRRCFADRVAPWRRIDQSEPRRALFACVFILMEKVRDALRQNHGPPRFACAPLYCPYNKPVIDCSLSPDRTGRSRRGNRSVGHQSRAR